MIDKILLKWYDSPLTSKRKVMQKMDKGELIFHMVIPFIMTVVTFAMGYFAVSLFRSVL
ncbi:MAG: hypothetical protein UW95_C0019G0025 [Parcubacteria group bacterium GW2011_GWC1_45_14]|nr:MAG: hypothetical protein UW87_C0036G0005 [Candidatus Moranbacteria bacterium GW2011_GWC2_45_10]KKT94025.1 MAG: hypothetical protein UW95_C0019G0025 [Parcubacteria group bacterium GW2011_GWC1_45_14]